MPAFNNATLVAAHKQMKPVAKFLRDRYFGPSRVKTHETAKVEVQTKIDGVQVAPWVHRNIGGKLMERAGGQATQYEAPETSPMRITTIDDVLAQGTSGVIGAKSPSERAAEIMADDLIDLNDAIDNLEELSIAEIITEGNLTVKGAGYDDIIAFWPPAAADKPYKALAGGELWSAATADIIGSLQSAKNWVVEKTGISPTEVILGAEAASAMLANEKLMKMLDNKAIPGGSFDVSELPSGASYMGRLPIVNLDLFTYGATMKVQNEDGVQSVKQLIDPKTVILANPSNPTVMNYGVVQLFGDGVNEINYVATARGVHTYIQTANPAGRIVQIKSRPLPVPIVPQSFYVLKVLA